MTENYPDLDCLNPGPQRVNYLLVSLFTVTVFRQDPGCFNERLATCLIIPTFQQLRKGRAQGISAADGVTEDACP